MAEIGHNNPPGAIPLADACFSDVGEWLKSNPVVQTEEEARAAKVILDRAIEALREVEQERDSKVRPLNEQVAEINGKYKAIHNPGSKTPGLYDKVVAEIKSRIKVFMDAEEARKLAALEEARKIAEEAERVAREAEEREREAAEEAKVGVETDVMAASVEADQAFSEFAKADRARGRAEKDAKIKVGGGFGRALGFRTQEILSVSDWNAAITEMGLTDKIAEAILTSAREYRKAFDELPDGIAVSHERKI